MRIKFYLGLTLGIGFTLFAVQNLHATPVHFLFWHVRLPLILTVLASAASGALWASLWITVERRRKQQLASDDSVLSASVPLPPAGR